MKPPHSQGSPLPWHVIEWMLGIEHRVTEVECATRHLGKMITAPKDAPPRWTPRDFMMAGAGISMVIAALFEKAGWSTVIAGLVRLYGGE